MGVFSQAIQQNIIKTVTNANFNNINYAWFCKKHSKEFNSFKSGLGLIKSIFCSTDFHEKKVGRANEILKKICFKDIKKLVKSDLN